MVCSSHSHECDLPEDHITSLPCLKASHAFPLLFEHKQNTFVMLPARLQGAGPVMSLISVGVTFSLKRAKLVPTPGNLHQLFCLPEMLFPLNFTQLAPSCLQISAQTSCLRDAFSDRAILPSAIHSLPHHSFYLSFYLSDVVCLFYSHLLSAYIPWLTAGKGLSSDP